MTDHPERKDNNAADASRAIHAKYLEANVATLRRKAQMIFQALQERDRDLQVARERLAFYESTETTFTSKLKEAEGEVEYYRAKWTEARSAASKIESKHVQDLETQVETAHATNKLLEEQLSAAQTALAQSQILARQQDELIQTLELKTKEQDKAIHEALLRQSQDMESLQGTNAALQAEIHQLKTQLSDQLNAKQSLEAEMERLEALNKTAASSNASTMQAMLAKDQAIETLTGECKALLQSLNEVQAHERSQKEAAASHVELVAVYEKQIQGLKVEIAQLSRSRNQLVEWKARKEEHWHAIHCDLLLDKTWLSWRVETLAAKRQVLQSRTMQLEAILPVLLQQVQSFKPTLSALRLHVQSSEQLWPPTIAAITLKCAAVVQERQRVQEERDRLHCEAADVAASFEQLEQAHVKASAQVVRYQKRSDALGKQLFHARQRMMSLICFYTWKSVHLRRVVGRWNNAVLLTPSLSNQEREEMLASLSPWHLMQSDGRVDFEAITAPLLRHTGTV
ncbi:hypothetical protein LEN26_004182 [Aphanomyces euteiches]|nr:hypothetical protein LEN26_004182 [Aphanomyces euteiches]